MVGEVHFNEISRDKTKKPALEIIDLVEANMG